MNDVYYQQAIDILNSEQNWREICVSVAKINPRLLCEAAKMTPWQIEARSILSKDGKIAAIKYVRDATGMGLEEAVEAVKSLGV